MKVIDENKTTLNQSRENAASPSSHFYFRATSHILTTPPNPLASNDHLDSQLTVENNFHKTFSPIHSAGFELTTDSNVQISSSGTTGTSFFTFETSNLEENDLKNHLNDKDKEENDNQMIKILMIDTNERINMNDISQNANSNQNSTKTNISPGNHNSQILKSAEGFDFIYFEFCILIFIF